MNKGFNSNFPQRRDSVYSWVCLCPGYERDHYPRVNLFGSLSQTWPPPPPSVCLDCLDRGVRGEATLAMNNVNISGPGLTIPTSQLQSLEEYCRIGFYSELEYKWKWSIWITSPQTRFTSNRYYSRRSIKYSKVKFFSIDFFQKHENLMEKFPVDEFCL